LSVCSSSTAAVYFSVSQRGHTVSPSMSSLWMPCRSHFSPVEILRTCARSPSRNLFTSISASPFVQIAFKLCPEKRRRSEILLHFRIPSPIPRLLIDYSLEVFKGEALFRSGTD